MVCESRYLKVFWGYALLAAALVILIFYVPKQVAHFVTMESDNERTRSISSQVAASNMETNPIPPEDVVKKLKVVDLLDFFHGYVESVQTNCNRVLRMGNIGDGGWHICDDPKYGLDKKNCLVYSFGINNDWSYDDAMESYGCEVHSYDPSMTKVQDHIRGQRIHFHQIGIGGHDVPKQTGKWAIFTLGTIRKQNNHQPSQRRVDIVKMDVEYSETPALLTAYQEGSLKDVRQLSVEFHVRITRPGDARIIDVTTFLKILRQLWNLGFRLYRTTLNSVPGNLYISKSMGIQRTSCIELNFINVKL